MPLEWEVQKGGFYKEVDFYLIFTMTMITLTWALLSHCAFPRVIFYTVKSMEVYGEKCNNLC